MISRETENVQSAQDVEAAFRALTQGDKPYITAAELYTVRIGGLVSTNVQNYGAAGPKKMNKYVWFLFGIGYFGDIVSFCCWIGGFDNLVDVTKLVTVKFKASIV